MKLPPGVRIEPINRLDGPWRWYYVDGHDNCWRVRNPVVLLALAIGWRPKRRIPRAVIAS
jgi:hypothetical protein